MLGAMIGTAVGAGIHRKVFGSDSNRAFGRSALLPDGLYRAVLTTGGGIAVGGLLGRIGHSIGGDATQGKGSNHQESVRGKIRSMRILSFPLAGLVFGIQYMFVDW